MKPHRVSVLLACVIQFLTALHAGYGQSNTRVDWYSLNNGLGVPASAASSALSISGQSVVGESRQANSVLQSGFAGYYARRSAVIAVADTPDAGTASRVTITVAIENLRVTDGTLFYRAAGAEGYSTVPVDTATLEAVIPASAVTIRGVEYHVLLNTNIGPLTLPQQTPATQPQVIRVRAGITPYGTSAPLVEGPQSIVARRYKMISIPLDVGVLIPNGVASINSILEDDYGTYRPNQWRIFHWEAGAYRESRNIAAPVSAGTAFWLITHSGAGFDLDSALSVPSDADYAIALEPGWNQIANPYAYPVAWDTVRTETGGPVSFPYFYDGQQLEYLDSVSVLHPWEGYFVFNSDTGTQTTLRIPTVDTSVRPPRAAGPVAGDPYIISMSAQVEGTEYFDSRNSVGLIEQAADEFDPYDVPEPPVLAEGLRMSVVESGVRYMRNYKTRNGEGQFWDMETMSPVPDKPVRVTIRDAGDNPGGFELYLLDMDEERALGLTDSTFNLHMKGINDVRHIRVIIGTKEFAEANSSGIPLIPLEYVLEQNFPNPFNPGTTIRYQLSKTGMTTMEVFNLLGQRITTLVHEEQKAGAYTVVWNGENSAGSIVASGVYIYRVRSGDFAAVKKMILLR